MLWSWRKKKKMVIIAKKNYEDDSCELKIFEHAFSHLLLTFQLTKERLSLSKTGYESQKNNKKTRSCAEKWNSHVLLWTLQHIQPVKPEMSKDWMALKLTNSCTVPSRGASGNRRRESGKGKKTPMQVSSTFLQVYQMLWADMCLQHKHARAQMISRWEEANRSLGLLILFSPHN